MRYRSPRGVSAPGGLLASIGRLSGHIFPEKTPERQVNGALGGRSVRIRRESTYSRAPPSLYDGDMLSF